MSGLCSQCSDGVAKHKLMLGTHTSNGEQNYLMIAAIHLPMPRYACDSRPCNRVAATKGTVSTWGVKRSVKILGDIKQSGKVEIKIKIKHRGEVNR